MAAAFVAPLHAQDDLSKKEKKQIKKEVAKTDKDLTKQIRKKAEKNARKEAKKLKKDGYMVFPGSLPIDKQLEGIWRRQLETNIDGSQKYLIADGNGVAGTQTAAEMQAMEAAKLQMAGQISNEINQIIESKIATEQIDRETANTLTKFVAGGKNYIIQNLQYIKPGFKVYREVGSRNLEVSLKIYYNVEEAMEAAKKAMEAKARKDLEGEADELIDQIDRLFNNDR